MRAHVNSESAAGCTSIIAFIALIWSHTGMHTLVCSERAAECTSIRALIAGVGPLARMHSFVSSEIAAIALHR